MLTFSHPTCVCARDGFQAELEFGVDGTWMDTHAIAIVAGLPRANRDCVDRVRSLLLKLVHRVATVHDVWLPMNAELAMSKGFAFIRTDSHLSAWKVATALDGFPWILPGNASDLVDARWVRFFAGKHTLKQIA